MALEFRLTARPLIYEQARLNVSLSATGVAFEFAHDDRQRLLLVPARVESGQLGIDVRHADLEALILAGAQAASASQGVNVQKVELQLTSLGPRSAAINLRVVAKKMFVTATLRIAGRLDIDEQLNASLSGLTCEGEGIVGTLATGVLRPKLQKLEGRSFPLMTFALGETRLRDIEIGTADPVTLKASFSN